MCLLSVYVRHAPGLSRPPGGAAKHKQNVENPRENEELAFPLPLVLWSKEQFSKELQELCNKHKDDEMMAQHTWVQAFFNEWSEVQLKQDTRNKCQFGNIGLAFRSTGMSTTGTSSTIGFSYVHEEQFNKLFR